MKDILPEELLVHTAEVHRFRHRKRSLVIYALLLILVLSSIIVLPFVRIPIYVTARGRIIGKDTQTGHLIAECKIRPGEIRLIWENAPLTYQIDAFDHNWGVATGKILDIGQDAEIIHGQVVFVFHSSIAETYLSLDSRHKAYLHKDQTLSAKIKITERSLFQLLGDHWNDWLIPNTQK